MKKSRLVLLLIPLSFGLLTGCSNSKAHLTFGTYINQDLNSLKVLDNVELKTKADNNETFMLAVYQGLYSDDCLCWQTYQNIIVSYMNTYHECVYLYDAQGQDESVSNLNIAKTKESEPYLYIFKGQKKLAIYSYKNNKDESLFKDADIMNEKVHKFITKPNAYYVDDDFLKENLSKNDQSIVAFVRRGCGDCNYVIPNYIIPYINKHDISKNIWIFDMQDLYDLARSETASEDEKALYQGVKDRYGLSSKNEIFGYQNGVVPTIQYYEKDVLKDATVFFNDEVSKKEDGSFYISESYYSEERLNNLSYLKDSKVNGVIKNMSIKDNSVMQTKSGAYYWLQSEAAKYHGPILNAFLDYYLL